MFKILVFKTLLVATTVTILSGCAAHTPLAKTNSPKWTELSCSGISTWHNCKQEAQAICPNGFYTADSLENLLIQRRVISVACKT